MAEQKGSGAAPRPFITSRVFDAPRQTVWKAWTSAEAAEWWGPKGVSVRVIKFDLRPGGVFHYVMRTPEGTDMWGKLTYREIVAPERLVFVVAFSDANQGITRHPMSATWPLEMLTTVTFAEQGGKTTVTVQWDPINPTEAERKTFDEGHDGMRQGWGGSFDRLADYLAKA